jgi:hypothetical protein
MNKRAANIISGSIFTAFGIFIAVSATFTRKVKAPYELGPAFFPIFSGSMLALLGLFISVYEFFKGEKTTIRFISRKFLAGVAVVVIFTILFKLFGYIIASMTAMAGIMVLMRPTPLKKSWIPMTITGILAPVLIWIIFAKLLLVSLP